MTGIRVYELAREQGVNSKELVAQLQELGCSAAKSASSTVPGEFVAQLRRSWRDTSIVAGERTRDLRAGEGRGFCGCCRRDGLPLAPLKLPGGLPAADTPRTCNACLHHNNGPQAAVAKEHREMAAVDARLVAQIGELRTELQDRPVKIRIQNLDQEVVDEARQQRDAALVSRDKAFRVLMAIKLLHQARPALSKCTCGLELSACRTMALVDGFAPLREWEDKQRERLRQGGQHYLPVGHPASRGDLSGTAWRE